MRDVQRFSLHDRSTQEDMCRNAIIAGEIKMPKVVFFMRISFERNVWVLEIERARGGLAENRIF